MWPPFITAVEPPSTATSGPTSSSLPTAGCRECLDEIHVVHEYLNVFLSYLPGMPHDKAIEFMIELQPSAAPVYKRPYPMA
jgi:hypothetical protein